MSAAMAVPETPKRALTDSESAMIHCITARAVIRAQVLGMPPVNRLALDHAITLIHQQTPLALDAFRMAANVDFDNDVFTIINLYERYTGTFKGGYTLIHAKT